MTNNTPKYFFAWIIGTLFRPLWFAGHYGKTIKCQISYNDKTGLVNAYVINENGETTDRIGRIIGQTDIQYSENDGVASEEDFIKAFGSTSVFGTIVSKPEKNRYPGFQVMIEIDES